MNNTSKKPGPDFPKLPGREESQAIFAAMIAALKGDDKLAGDILRHVSETVLKDFVPKELRKSG